MKPGREVDKMVAEAMGRRVVAVEGDYVLATEPGKPYDKLPEYSADSAAAWRAWEWLEQNHPSVKNGKRSIALGRLRGERPLVYLEYGGEVDDIIARGDTYPHAICIAILKSVEGGEGG